MLQNASIVVVDDEPDVLSMVSDYLGRDGYSVSGCSSGAELDRALDKTTPDLLVLDVNMPGEDGISIARRLQATHRFPIVMLTALGDTIDRVVGLEVGADDYVTKPFDLRELAARVRAVLRRAEASGERPATPDAAARSETKREEHHLFRSRPSSTLMRAACATATAASCRSRQPNSRCCRPSHGTRTRCCRGIACWAMRPNMARPAATGRSTSGLRASGRESRSIRPGRRSSGPCAASATSTFRRAEEPNWGARGKSLSASGEAVPRNDFQRDAVVYAAVVDSALDAVIVVDEEGRVVTMNASAETTFGYSKSEAIGRSIGA